MKRYALVEREGGPLDKSHLDTLCTYLDGEIDAAETCGCRGCRKTASYLRPLAEELRIITKEEQP